MLEKLAFVKCYRSFKNIGLLLSGPVHLTLNGGAMFSPPSQKLFHTKHDKSSNLTKISC